MIDMKSLDQLGPVADEMLGGLHADESMRLRIKRAAAQPQHTARKTTMKRLAPALCCAALAIACVSAMATRLNPPADDANTPAAASMDQPLMIAAEGGEAVAVAIDTIAAGEEAAFDGGELMAGLGDGAAVRSAAPKAQTLFASGSGDIPLVSVGGAVYQMLATPKDVGGSLLGGEIGSVKTHEAQPSLASGDAMRAGLSNVAKEGAAIYALRGMDESCVVAAEVDGSMRLFQRVSYAGKGPSGASLEDTFSVRGKVKKAELSGVGTLEGEAANKAIAVLLDQAVLKSADASARKQTLTVTLDSGIKLQLGVSGDTLCGCGGWSCPEFFEAFEAAL
ncbi:MAG: hypothetical protein IJB85_02780 [Clostridia bacterium]|nr:hypothetical protein [Clostridia bacterium]